MRWHFLSGGTLALLSLFRFVGYVRDPLLTAAEIHQVVGEPARVNRVPASRGVLKIVTWNIERGVEYEAIESTLRSLDADVLLLQEVDRFCGRSNRRDVAHDLARDLDMNWVWGGEFQEVGESVDGIPALTGQAILSRAPIDAAETIVFRSQAGWRWTLNPAQPRRGGRVALRARTAGVPTYNLHLESTGSDSLRTRQLKELLNDDGGSRGSQGIMAGDFNNSHHARSGLVDRLRSHGFDDTSGNRGQTRTSVNHPYTIDWIFTRGLGLRDFAVPQTVGSDHFPVVVVIADPTIGL
jgi:endonuclease/exonuclease/phosphatase family metal-dependent hydrolase